MRSNCYYTASLSDMFKFLIQLNLLILQICLCMDSLALNIPQKLFMFNIFYPRIPSDAFGFDPQKYGNRPGLPCPLCKELIIHHASVSLCQCRIFTHKKCFLKQFPLKEQQAQSNEVDRRQSGKSLLNGLSFLKRSSSQYPNFNQQSKHVTKRQCKEVKKNSNNVDLNGIQIKAKQKNKTQQATLQTMHSKVKVIAKKEQNFDPQFSKPICKNCDKQIQVEYQSVTILQPHFRPLKNLLVTIFWAILFVFFVVMIISCFVQNNVISSQIQTSIKNRLNQTQPNIQSRNQMLEPNLRGQSQNYNQTDNPQKHHRQYASPLGIILYSYSAALSLILMITFMVTVLFEKKFMLSGVKVTQKSLQISAFEGIGQNMVFEDTNQQMFKKEVTL